jgi:hypothetical protein
MPFVSSLFYESQGVKAPGRVNGKEVTGVNERWQHQVRIYLSDHLAEVARADPFNPVLNTLTNILERHDAKLISQFDSFAHYVAYAEQHGADRFPLYRWTKATIEDPVKRAHHIGTFAIHVGGSEVYARESADALEVDLQGLVGGPLVSRISRHDTNPANNPRAPAEHRS